MVKYRIYLNDGTQKIIKANSPTNAKNAYYGSRSHFQTEASVTKVKVYEPVRRRAQSMVNRVRNRANVGADMGLRYLGLR